MHSTQDLTGLCVLVTRPAPRGETLCEEIHARGGDAVFFPAIVFYPPENLEEFKQKLAHLNQFDWVIFTSPQAVQETFNILGELPLEIKIAAVGAGTAALLSERVIYPRDDWRSEGLLNLPEFQQVRGQKIAIIKGAGGRMLLADELTARGAVVTQVIAYRRELPHINPKTLTWTHDLSVNVIVCASNETMQNVKNLLPDLWPRLHTIPIVVVSQRMQQRARELGFQQIFLARNVAHDAVIETLSEVRKIKHG